MDEKRMKLKSYVTRTIPDEIYLKYEFRKYLGYKLDLKQPKTFNQKLQWLKLHDRNPNYTIMVDKYSVKKYVASIIGEEYIIPTLGVWDHFDDIDFSKLPKQFVLKCTHDSGGLVIVKDSSKLDRLAAKEKIESCLKTNYYWSGREWPYKNVKPKIIAEKYMADKYDRELKDYKIHCFNGIPKLILVCSDRYSEHGLCEDFYTEERDHLSVKRVEHPNSKMCIDKPTSLEQMKNLAKKLSKDLPFVRTDFYDINGSVFFGEMTFYPASGFSGYDPMQWDYILGEWLDLSKLV